MMKKLLFALLPVLGFILLFTGRPAEAAGSVMGSGLAEGQVAIMYDATTGMPTSEANTITQTEDGFIWIGSYSGLIRYDGKDFNRFDSSTGISSVVCLFVDSNDRLWVGTNDNGLAMYDRGDFTFLEKEDGLCSASIRSIAEDDAGNIYVATTQGLSYIDDSGAVHTFSDKELKDTFIDRLESDSAGTIYGLTVDGNLFSIEGKKLVHFIKGTDISDDPLNCVYPDPEKPGCIYVGTEGSRILYGKPGRNFKKLKTFSVRDQVHINAIRLYNDTLWICSDDGIGTYDKKNRYSKLTNVGLTNSVDTMMKDHEGNLWFASSRQGIMKITTSMFKNVSADASLPEKVVNSTCMYQGNLYIGTDDELIILDKHKKRVKTKLTKKLKGERIRSIKTDSKDNLWLATYSDYGLICLHGDGSFDTYNTETAGFASDRVRTVTELSDGIICVSTSGGVYFLKDGEVVNSFGGEDGISNTEILTICENKQEDSVLLGSDGDGIYQMDRHNVVGHIGLEDGLKSEVILRIKYDELHNVHWIITSNSIAYLKDGQIHNVDHFPYANNFDIFADNDGRLWVLSSGGIYIANAEDMLRNKKNISYDLCDSDRGLPYVTTANSRSCVTEDGELYICGTLGVCSVNIHDDTKDTTEVKLCVPYIEADDQVIYLDEDKDAVIPSGTKRLTIHSYALTYSLDNPRLSYSLEGFDSAPVSTTKRDFPEVTYTNLDGGIYTFHFALMDVEGVSEEKSLDVNITKTRALYEHLWFMILAALLIILVIVLFVTLQIWRKEKAAEKKQRETQDQINQITKAFAKCIDMKDRYTNGHSFRVANYTRKLVRKLGYPEPEVERIYNIALLHDIGKLSIPDAILNKPEGLNDEEYEIMKSHAKNGYEILNEITIAPDLAIGAGYHHERLDGKGYPRGLTEEDIPEIAQIIAVADTFDAMYSTRPYRKKLPLSYVLEEMGKVAGTQLNAKVVKCLQELADEGEIQ